MWYMFSLSKICNTYFSPGGGAVDLPIFSYTKSECTVYYALNCILKTYNFFII